MRIGVLAAIAAACTAVLALVSTAEASRQVRYGIQDDAWLVSSEGTLDERLDELDALGVELVRFSLRWDQIARTQPANARAHADPAYDWRGTDGVLRGLRDRGIAAVVSIWGTPGWANGGKPASWAPASEKSVAAFAYAAASRYPWVRDWLVWNEPNQRRWLVPTSPAVYVKRLLNPAYTALHAANPAVRVGGGVTAPRGNPGGVSPVEWIRGMSRAGARLDAYAHNPYPTKPGIETPWSGGCASCAIVTMATLERLIEEVGRAFGPKRIWLTEYGYQSNPPDTSLGVSPATQARFVSEAALRAYLAPRVDMLIHFMLRDDTREGGWQSGLRWATGRAKPARKSFRLPIGQVSRRGARTVVWGQIRPRSGRQPYRLQLVQSGRWVSIGGARLTDARGFFTREVRAAQGSRVRIWSARDRTYSSILRVR